MNIKKYYAKDMQEAMKKIRQDLGSDAIILSSRPYKKKGLLNIFAKPMFEVIATVEPKPYIPPAQSQPKPEIKPKVDLVADEPITIPVAEDISKERFEKLDNRIVELEGMLEGFVKKFGSMGRAGSARFPDPIQILYEKMLENDVEETLAVEIAHQTNMLLQKFSDESAEEIMQQLICQHIGEPVTVKPKKFTKNIVVFAGPTGAGKTTTLVKLAAQLAVEQGLKVGIINSDTYRIAAQEQLKTYADILQVPLNIIYSPQNIGEALQMQDDRDIIFVDTAGKRPGDEKHREDLEQIIGISKADDIYLVLSASTGIKALRRMIDSYAYLNRHSLIITKIDEVANYGSILNSCHFSGRPISYLTIGQSVPDDIMVADPREIACRVLR